MTITAGKGCGSSRTANGRHQRFNTFALKAVSRERLEAAIDRQMGRSAYADRHETIAGGLGPEHGVRRFSPRSGTTHPWTDPSVALIGRVSPPRAGE